MIDENSSEDELLEIAQIFLQNSQNNLRVFLDGCSGVFNQCLQKTNSRKKNLC